MDLPAHDIAGGHECASPWHRIVWACHRNGLPARVDVDPRHQPSRRWWCKVAEEDNVTPVIHHWADSLAIHASAGCRVARMCDGANFARGGFPNINTIETVDDYRLRGEVRGTTLLA